MDWNQVEGNWRQLKGSAKAQWGKLTDADLMQIEGRREQLEGKIQERYGYTKERVRKELDDWYRSVVSDLRESGGDLSGEIDAIRADLQNLTSTVARVANKQIERAQDTAVGAVQQADEAIRRNPLTSIALAVGLGLLVRRFHTAMIFEGGDATCLTRANPKSRRCNEALAERFLRGL